MSGQTDMTSLLASLSRQSQSGHTPQPNPSHQAPASTPYSSQSLGQPPPGAMSLGNLASGQASQGQISVSEAIAKVRGAKVNDDPRLSARPRGRSRSRSPRRRETFHDNYNPYRDERRNDSRRGASGRPRSPSPGPPTPQYGRGYSAPDSNSEVIAVESSAVGLVIGRNGDNMRRIEQTSGARVQFITPPDRGPRRECRVTGSAQQRMMAINEINRVAAENPHGSRSSANKQPIASPLPPPPPANDKNNIQIMVPDKTVGLIIGRGGESIRDLQGRSGCHINIVGEDQSRNGQRPVNLIGSRAEQDRAKSLIYEIVDSDTRGGSQQQQPPAQQAPPSFGMPFPQSFNGYQPPFNPAPPQQSSERTSDSIRVPSDAVGMIIGKSGETIKNMQNDSGAKINVSPPSAPDIDRHIEILGTRAAIEQAKRLIWDKVSASREKQGGHSANPPAPSYGAANPPYSQPPYGYGMPQGQMPPSMPSYPLPGPSASAGPGAPPNAGYPNPNDSQAQQWQMFQQFMQRFQGQPQQ